MAKKPHDFTDLSIIACCDCNKPLKKNVVERVDNPLRCYVCHLLSKGKKSIGTKNPVDLEQKQKNNRKAYNWLYKKD